jgi:hypothetical protein
MSVQERIARMLRTDQPFLAQFPADQLAVDRDYRSQDMVAAVNDFISHRCRTVEMLKVLEDDQWERTAEFEDEGIITVERLIEIILEHDRTHRREIDNLLQEIQSIADLCEMAREERRAYFEDLIRLRPFQLDVHPDEFLIYERIAIVRGRID